MYLRLGSKAARSKVEVRVMRVLTSSGRIRPSSRPSEPLSPDSRPERRPRSTATPISLVRELLVGLRQDEGAAVAVHPHRIAAVERPGEHEAAAREEPGPQPDASVGVRASAVARFRSRSTPTGMPRKNSAARRRPAARCDVESGYTRRSRVLVRSPFRFSMPIGCQVSPAELRHRWLSASVGEQPRRRCAPPDRGTRSSWPRPG